MAKYSNIEKLFQKVNKDLDDVRKEFYYGLAEVLVRVSPVDTGAYMDSHNIGTDTTRAGYTSKEGEHKAQGVSRGPVEERTLARLSSEIESIPEDATKVYIANCSPHSKFVEDGGKGWKTPGYAPFRIMRREAKRVLDSAVANVKGRSQ
ncbi:hypothetical protein UFOVP59_78 [uncultured Caudovirales phage]|uniref:Uncharacterized protein n=1 Tax=uncultured Caudovirales phage TaxID=2100421 RepID=A0A6J7WS36_9CAUD|nr:hypothetical protein UFOVP59_78 [uncultured Caudovirales phage]CAB5220781.1 hypothetical protein UFOVP246_37 [uncultured Caudovirales phage]